MIKNILNKHLPKAFDNQLNDAVKPFKGTRKGKGGHYDPMLDEYVGSNDIEYQGRGVFGRFETDETKDTQVNISDVKLTALTIEVTANPQIDDVITQGNKDYRILNVSIDPTDTIWILQLRGLNVE